MELAVWVVTIVLVGAALAFGVYRVARVRGIELARYMYPGASFMFAVSAIIQLVNGERLMAAGARLGLSLTFGWLALSQRAKMQSRSTSL